MFYARSGGAAAVPPYAADATNKHSWELEQRKHEKAMNQLTGLRRKKAVDQKEPETFVDDSLLLGRIRSRAFVEHVHQRQVDQENKKLMGALHEIAAKPCMTLRKIQSEPGMLPPLVCDGNKAAVRRRKQQAILSENEQMVKRLLSIKTTFDPKKDQKEYIRHHRAVQDMAKVPPPGGVLPRQRQHRRQIGSLPPLPAYPTSVPGSRASVASEDTFIPAASSRPFASRSVPAIMAQRQNQNRAISPTAAADDAVSLEQSAQQDVDVAVTAAIAALSKADQMLGEQDRDRSYLQRPPVDTDAAATGRESSREQPPPVDSDTAATGSGNHLSGQDECLLHAGSLTEASADEAAADLMAAVQDGRRVLQQAADLAAVDEDGSVTRLRQLRIKHNLCDSASSEQAASDLQLKPSPCDSLCSWHGSASDLQIKTSPCDTLSSWPPDGVVMPVHSPRSRSIEASTDEAAADRQLKPSPCSTSEFRLSDTLQTEMSWMNATVRTVQMYDSFNSGQVSDESCLDAVADAVAKNALQPGSSEIVAQYFEASGSSET